MEKCLICQNKTVICIDKLYDDRYGAPGLFSIRRCPICGFGRIEPGLAEKEIGQFYAKYYPLSSSTASAVRARTRIEPGWRRWLSGTNNISHLYVKPDKRVLDIGSASGVSLLELKQLGAEPYGVEPDPTAAKLAEELKLNVFTGQITDNPFPGLKFDYITGSQVIEHTPDPARFLATIKTRLAPGGQIVLSFPNTDSLARRIWGRYWINWHVPYHSNFFTRRSFKLLTDQSGFTVLKLKTITPNLWTVLQITMFRQKTEAGQMHPIWANQHRKKKPGSRPVLIKRLGRQVAIVSLYAVSAIINRLIDLSGLGESFLAILVKKDD